MRRLRAGVVAASLLAVGAATAIGRPALPTSRPVGDPDPRDRQALTAVCGACHPVNLVEDNVRSYDGWQEIVRKMVEHGAKGSDEQFDRVGNYLYLTLTTINVNSAAPEDIAAILGVSPPAAQAIVARRTARKFTSLVDLAQVAGVAPAHMAARRRRIGF